MKASQLIVSGVTALLVLCPVAAPAEPGAAVISLRFADVEYIHQWANADQHEFTPRGQDDLEHWTDMVIINTYRTAKDGGQLAATANAVLANYKNSGAKILRTSAVPRTPVKPAEYLIIAVFGQPAFIEASFARFVLVNGVGLSLVYSHREYGNHVGDQMNAWLQAHGPATEQALMNQKDIPQLDAAKP